ncbi:hypothetical protein PAPHI01_2157 [Pancytospora philotis]|nr:hypothetical protein PAPHI01_2157 [Pancytospora philotis]
MHARAAAVFLLYACGQHCLAGSPAPADRADVVEWYHTGSRCSASEQQVFADAVGKFIDRTITSFGSTSDSAEIKMQQRDFVDSRRDADKVMMMLDLVEHETPGSDSSWLVSSGLEALLSVRKALAVFIRDHEAGSTGYAAAPKRRRVQSRDDYLEKAQALYRKLDRLVCDLRSDEELYASALTPSTPLLHELISLLVIRADWSKDALCMEFEAMGRRVARKYNDPRLQRDFNRPFMSTMLDLDIFDAETLEEMAVVMIDSIAANGMNEKAAVLHKDAFCGILATALLSRGGIDGFRWRDEETMLNFLIQFRKQLSQQIESVAQAVLDKYRPVLVGLPSDATIADFLADHWSANYRHLPTGLNVWLIPVVWHSRIVADGEAIIADLLAALSNEQLKKMLYRYSSMTPKIAPLIAKIPHDRLLAFHKFVVDACEDQSFDRWDLKLKKTIAAQLQAASRISKREAARTARAAQ